MMSNVGVTLACAVVIPHTPRELLVVVVVVAVEVGAVGEELPPPPPQLIASTALTRAVRQRILKRQRSIVSIFILQLSVQRARVPFETVFGVSVRQLHQR